MTKTILRALAALAVFAVALPGPAFAQAKAPVPAEAAPPAQEALAEYLIAAGDVIRITVFQSPDLTLETRVAENGTISYPLIGTVTVGGLGVGAVEQRIAKALRDGGFMVSPHVSVAVVQVRGNQVTVLGLVGKPGRYPYDSTDSKLTDLIALAGGIASGGADTVFLTGIRDGKPMRREIDLQAMATSGDPSANVRLQPGDMLYVPRAPSFYIYGEVQKPGSYRLERGMSVMQALATGGGLTAKGTQRGLKVHRRSANGVVQIIEPKLDDLLMADDILYVQESLF